MRIKLDRRDDGVNGLRNLAEVGNHGPDQEGIHQEDRNLVVHRQGTQSVGKADHQDRLDQIQEGNRPEGKEQDHRHPWSDLADRWEHHDRQRGD